METRQGEKITWSDEPWLHPGSWVVHAAGYRFPLPVSEYEERPPLEDGMIWTGNEFVTEPDVRGCSCGMADYGTPGHDGGLQ